MASVDYLVGHVAVGDGRAGEAGSALTRYYTAAGYPPGTWLGAGLGSLGAADRVGTAVTEGQLRLLFEQARDPFGGAALGRPPARYPTRQERIERRVAALPDELTAEARSAAVARIEAEERETRTRSAVAGFDLTFSVPKSVSALWAIAPAGTQRALYEAHRAALLATLGLIEAEAIYTRTGASGARRVRTTGVVAAAFDHWDSRKGDPQLHTHVVIANRVQGPDGRWRTLDSSTLHRAVVAYSETYNQLLADEVTRRTGLTWTSRERDRGSHRRVGRELAVVPDGADRGVLPAVRGHRGRGGHRDRRAAGADRAPAVDQVDQPDPAAPDAGHPGPQAAPVARRRRPAVGGDRHGRPRDETRPAGQRGTSTARPPACPPAPRGRS